MAFTAHSAPPEPFVQLMNRQKGADLDVPHQEQTVSSLPIRCLHRGQSIARGIVFLSEQMLAI